MADSKKRCNPSATEASTSKRPNSQQFLSNGINPGAPTGSQHKIHEVREQLLTEELRRQFPIKQQEYDNMGKNWRQRKEPEKTVLSFAS
jgi:hypothetical protein